MFSTLHRRLLTALLISFSFAAFPTLTFANHSWGGYHWARRSNPFTLNLGDNVSSTWDPYLATTASDWSGSLVLDTARVAGGVTNTKNCKPTSGRVEVCSARYGFNGWLGLAQIWISGKHITQGIVKVNDSYFSTATYNTPGWRNLVMCQEVGHTLGLDHQDETFDNPNLGTCMDYTSDPDGTIKNQLSNEHPNQHDYDELVTIYSHLDSTTTVSATIVSKMPPVMGDIGLGGPAQLGTGQWGKLIRSTNQGRTELYELDVDGRRKMFTFVIWAEGDGEEQGQR